MNLPDCTNTPTRLRIFLDEMDGFFSLDGADGEGNYTEGVWSGFRTIKDAWAAIPAFVEATRLDGVTWLWEPERPKSARRINYTRPVA